MGVNIDLQGVPGLLDMLDKYGENVELTKNKALKAAAAIVRDEAKRSTAFKDHHELDGLRANIKIGEIKTDKKNGKYITVDSTVPYAKMVEFGTSRAAPHPYLAPALENKGEEAYEAIVQVLEGALK